MVLTRDINSKQTSVVKHQIKSFRPNQNPNENDANGLNILFLAPHPFYQDRGTPIDDCLFLRVLSEKNYKVDVIAFPEGRDIELDNVTIHRTLKVPFVEGVRPGFSWKKLVYDILMVFKVMQMVSTRKYDLIQAVEESVFIALLMKVMLGIPYVYDMDSSIAQQMVEQMPWLKPLAGVFNWFEKIAVQNAKSVLPVCHAIADDIADYKPENITILPDISLLEDSTDEVNEDIRKDLGIQNQVLMYVGNLEGYQGIDLLLESFALTLKSTDQVDLVIIGGDEAGIEKYQAKSAQLGIQHKVHFLGQRPAQHLSAYLSQADILVSPRTKGINTPMKVYSYLDSGKAVLATDLLTHTQVLTPEISKLAQPVPEDFSQAMIELINNPSLCSQLGNAGQEMIQEKHSYSAFSKTVNGLYRWLQCEIFPTQIQAGLE
ncbi:glycosyl transferases group 1 family protein [Lyngbya aestuarii BL J]|uniref:Glycosyl transferases group 1 family protein n=1 Tax=Lyngbya aestuarii BL J TaxID=1348334 RepID=U7QAE6_9CYAN|nr:glycosyltransferase family 4 protein [Lyngbya aestuarii]ERT04814.1 glycosyl transferases group 1 family protein [Lyngbya aestuarii BL J]